MQGEGGRACCSALTRLSLSAANLFKSRRSFTFVRDEPLRANTAVMATESAACFELLPPLFKTASDMEPRESECWELPDRAECAEPLELCRTKVFACTGKGVGIGGSGLRVWDLGWSVKCWGHRFEPSSVPGRNWSGEALCHGSSN